MQALGVSVENSVCVENYSLLFQHIIRKAFFVLLFYLEEAFAKLLIMLIFHKTFKLSVVLQESVAYIIYHELCQPGVCLCQPSAMSYAVCYSKEFTRMLNITVSEKLCF